MLNQMSALREDRKLNQLDLESEVSMFPLVPGLIPNFDPNAPQARPLSSNFHLRISPDCMLSPECFYQKKSMFFCCVSLDHVRLIFSSLCVTYPRICIN